MSIDNKKLQGFVADLRLYVNSDESFYKGSRTEIELPNIIFTTGLNDNPESRSDIFIEIRDEDDALVRFNISRSNILYLYNFLKTYLELNE